MEYSKNYNLKKPAKTDFYNVDDQNSNMQIIDEHLGDIRGWNVSADGQMYADKIINGITYRITVQPATTDSSKVIIVSKIHSGTSEELFSIGVDGYTYAQDVLIKGLSGGKTVKESINSMVEISDWTGLLEYVDNQGITHFDSGIKCQKRNGMVQFKRDGHGQLLTTSNFTAIGILPEKFRPLCNKHYDILDGYNVSTNSVSGKVLLVNIYADTGIIECKLQGLGTAPYPIGPKEMANLETIMYMCKD